MAGTPGRRLPIAGAPPPAPSPAPGAIPKRRLPVLQGDAGEAEEERPPWHWVALGAVAIFLVWLPLAALANALLRPALSGAGAAPSPPVQALMVAVNALAFALSGAAGGALVGRFGGRAGAREATASGLAAGLVAWALAVVQGAPAGVLGWAMLLVVIATLGSAAARLGGRVGLRLRPPGAPRGD